MFYLSLCWTWKGPVACRVPHDAQHWRISCVFTTSWISSFKTVSVASLLSWTEGRPDCHFMWIHGSDFEMQESSFFWLLNFAISARCKGLHYHIQNVCLNTPDPILWLACESKCPLLSVLSPVIIPDTSQL